MSKQQNGCTLLREASLAPSLKGESTRVLFVFPVPLFLSLSGYPTALGRAKSELPQKANKKRLIPTAWALKSPAAILRESGTNPARMRT